MYGELAFSQNTTIKELNEVSVVFFLLFNVLNFFPFN